MRPVLQHARFMHKMIVIMAALAVTSVSSIVLFLGQAMAVPANAMPAPSVTDTSIAKEVASTIVYRDQEQADALAGIIIDMNNEIEASASGTRTNVPTTCDENHDKKKNDEVNENSESDISELDIENAVSNPVAATTHEGPSYNLHPMEISINGDVLSYIDYFKEAAAPAHGAGLWMGSDSTTDGSWGYFIGHNPGDFTAVMSLVTGDPIRVCDRNGDIRTYHVVDSFQVPDTTYFEDIQDKVCNYGESIVVQTCCGDGSHYRVVVAD